VDDNPRDLCVHAAILAVGQVDGTAL